MCKKRLKKAVRTEAQDPLDSNDVHDIEGKITITVDSGATVSAMRKEMLPSVPKSGGPGNKFHRVAKQITFKAKHACSWPASMMWKRESRSVPGSLRISQSWDLFVFSSLSAGPLAFVILSSSLHIASL